MRGLFRNRIARGRAGYQSMRRDCKSGGENPIRQTPEYGYEIRRYTSGE
jgi:hypothetical protein